MTRRVARLLMAVLVPLAAALPQEPARAKARPDREEVWRHFEQWVRTTPGFTGGAPMPPLARWADALAEEGVAPAEIQRRMGLVNEARVVLPARQSVYYDAVYKFGGGPEDPIGFLVASAKGLKLGRAVDVAMGNGRNGLYLARLGWDVTGYDISPEAVRVATARARQAGVPFHPALASHDTFEWGREAWDLTVVSYASGWEWSRRLDVLWRALRPGGVIVCDHACADLTAELKLRPPLRWRLLDYRDAPQPNEGWGLPNVAVSRIQALVRKE
jgi:SAM-dependent methyltransferase